MSQHFLTKVLTPLLALCALALSLLAHLGNVPSAADEAPDRLRVAPPDYAELIAAQRVEIDALRQRVDELERAASRIDRLDEKVADATDIAVQSYEEVVEYVDSQQAIPDPSTGLPAEAEQHAGSIESRPSLSEQISKMRAQTQKSTAASGLQGRFESEPEASDAQRLDNESLQIVFEDLRLEGLLLEHLHCKQTVCRIEYRVEDQLARDNEAALPTVLSEYTGWDIKLVYDRSNPIRPVAFVEIAPL